MKNIARALALILAITALVQTETAASSTIDRRRPSISITTPMDGATADGLLTVTGSAWDNRRLKKVEVKVDGDRYRRASGRTNWIANIDTSLYRSGTHTLTVRAVDRHGNKRVRRLNVVFGQPGQEEELPPLPPPGPSGEVITPEGTRIEVTAGLVSADQIYAILKANGLNDTIGPMLTVKVQNQYPSQVAASTAGSGGSYTDFSATMYLMATNVLPASQLNAIIGHEWGHVWTLYHLYLSQQGDWTKYLEARGIKNHAKLDSTYAWSRTEIIADDYRLLFGSAAAIAERPTHLNSALPDPRQIAGLRSFFVNTWAS